MTSTNDASEPNDPHRADDRIELLLLEDGAVVYDSENPAAWLRSDEPVPLAERR